jgi:hypothetical protein
MGVDIYLESVWKPFEEEILKNSSSSPSKAVSDMEAFIQRHYDEMRASGGYFRNGYNAGDIMWAMGLSWNGTVFPMLDEDCCLPITRAIELVEMIEARPLTRDVVAAHLFEHMTDGINTHPVSGAIMEMVEMAKAEVTNEKPQKKLPPDFDSLFALLNERRDQLLVILRKSIKLNEPLLVSV